LTCFQICIDLEIRPIEEVCYVIDTSNNFWYRYYHLDFIVSDTKSRYASAGRKDKKKTGGKGRRGRKAVFISTVVKDSAVGL
jgi:hypothetical protein